MRRPPSFGRLRTGSHLPPSDGGRCRRGLSWGLGAIFPWCRGKTDLHLNLPPSDGGRGRGGGVHTCTLTSAELLVLMRTPAPSVSNRRGSQTHDAGLAVTARPALSRSASGRAAIYPLGVASAGRSGRALRTTSTVSRSPSTRTTSSVILSPGRLLSAM